MYGKTRELTAVNHGGDLDAREGTHCHAGEQKPEVRPRGRAWRGPPSGERELVMVDHDHRAMMSHGCLQGQDLAVKQSLPPGLWRRPSRCFRHSLLQNCHRPWISKWLRAK